jgi:hypothetical protein
MRIFTFRFFEAPCCDFRYIGWELHWIGKGFKDQWPRNPLGHSQRRPPTELESLASQARWKRRRLLPTNRIEAVEFVLQS